MKPLILNVDDNESGRYIKTRLLRQGGYEVIEARTGMEALEVARRERPDLVLLDVKLPDINGFEVCRLIKKQDIQLLVLQISASFVAPQDRAVGLDSGADAYLSQPVEPSELLATIRALLRLKRAEQAAEQSNELYRMIVQSVVDHAIITVDQNGLIQSWSEGAQRVLGWAEVEVLGQSAVLNFMHKRTHAFPIFFATVANNILWWTFIKACWKSLLSLIPGRAKITFKTTMKGAAGRASGKGVWRSDHGEEKRAARPLKTATTRARTPASPA